MEAWFPRQVLAIQHGNASAPKDYWMNESSSGPAALSREELDANYCDTLANARAREMDDGWYRRRSPDWSKVITPFLSAGSWQALDFTRVETLKRSRKLPRKKNGLRAIPVATRNGSISNTA